MALYSARRIALANGLANKLRSLSFSGCRNTIQRIKRLLVQLDQERLHIYELSKTLIWSVGAGMQVAILRAGYPEEQKRSLR